MRINKIVILFFPFILFSCVQKGNDFLEKVLSDYSLHSYFIFLEITDGKNNAHVVVENLSLFSYIVNTQDLEVESYKKVVKNSLKKNEPILVKDLTMFSSINIGQVDFSIQRSEFIKKYFDSKKMIKDEYLDIRNQIIANCFVLKILCKTDSETGFIIYEEDPI